MQTLFAWCGLIGCSGLAPLTKTEEPAKPEQALCVLQKLDEALPWYGDNRKRLDAFMAKYGCASPAYNAKQKPVAVFDWDNTVIKNDIGDGFFFWLLQHDKIIQPSGGDFAKTSRFLATDAVAALNEACGNIVPTGAPLPTSTHLPCGELIWSIYYDEKLPDGKRAWVDDGYSHRQLVPAWAWAAQLQAGYRPDEIRAYAGQVVERYLAAKVGSQQMLGSKSLAGWIRIYPQMQNLIAALQQNGFDVWIVSASPQYVVEMFAEKIGIAADHVIGIRTQLDAKARTLTTALTGCAPFDRSSDTLITYMEGKRCFINQVIFGDQTETAAEKRAVSSRQVFAAGDADTDITFLQDATQLKLVINRNKTEIMCNAYHNAGGQWLVNPMFIEPKSHKKDPYPCTTGCKTAYGTDGPCADENGSMIANQTDVVFVEENH